MIWCWLYGTIVFFDSLPQFKFNSLSSKLTCTVGIKVD